MPLVLNLEAIGDNWERGSGDKRSSKLSLPWKQGRGGVRLEGWLSLARPRVCKAFWLLFCLHLLDLTLERLTLL